MGIWGTFWKRAFWSGQTGQCVRARAVSEQCEDWLFLLDEEPLECVLRIILILNYKHPFAMCEERKTQDCIISGKFWVPGIVTDIYKLGVRIFVNS